MRLLARAREGDQQALEEVLDRAIPLLKRWASGRLPHWARDMVDTDNLVQDTIINTLKRSTCSSTGWTPRFRRTCGRR